MGGHFCCCFFSWGGRFLFDGGEGGEEGALFILDALVAAFDPTVPFPTMRAIASSGENTLFRWMFRSKSFNPYPHRHVPRGRYHRTTEGEHFKLFFNCRSLRHPPGAKPHPEHSSLAHRTPTGERLANTTPHPSSTDGTQNHMLLVHIGPKSSKRLGPIDASWSRDIRFAQP